MFYSHKLHVAYVPAKDLTREELTKYAAGMGHRIPEELISIYPEKALFFKNGSVITANIVRSKRWRVFRRRSELELDTPCR